MRITDLKYCDWFTFQGKELIYQFETSGLWFDGKVHFSYFMNVDGKLKRYKSTGNKYVNLVKRFYL